MGVTYLSDKRRVELALPAALLHRIFAACIEHSKGSAEGEEFEYDREVITALRVAAIEPLEGLDPRRQRKLAVRVTRMQAQILDPFEDRPIMVCFLFVLYWLKGLLDDGTLVLIDGSPFEQAVSALIPELSKHEDLWEAMEKSAVKNARKLTQALRGEGFYTKPD